MLKRARSIMFAQSCGYRWLPLLIVAMTVVALGIGTLILKSVEQHLIHASGQMLTLAAAEVADKTVRFLYERLGDVQMMARAFSVQPADRAYQGKYLAWVKSAYAPSYLWLGVTDQHGRIVAATNDALLGQDLGGSRWFRAARDARGAVVADVDIHEADNGVETVAFTAPILDGGGRFFGVVTARIGVPRIEETATETIRSLEREAGFSGGIEYQMLTRTGQVFVDSDLWHKGNTNLQQMGLPSAIASMNGTPGFVEEEHLRRRVPVVSGYATTKGLKELTSFGWTVLVRTDRAVVLEPIRSILWKVGAAGAIVWCPLLAALLWSTLRLRTEYRQVQQESAWARAAEAALLQSQERNRAVVDTALDGLIMIDSTGVITDWNLQSETLFGWKRDEVLGRLLADTIIPAQHREAHMRGIKRFLETGVGPILNRRIETSGLHREGREFPIELSVSPARIGEEHFFSAFIRDITDRRRAERRLSSQYAVSRALSESNSLEDAAPHIIRAMGESLEWELGVFWRLDKATGTLRCLSHWHAPTAKVDEFVASSQKQIFGPGVGLPGRILQSGEAAWIRDVTTDTNFPRTGVATAVGLHGALGFPIRIGGEIEAVIELLSSQVRDPDEELLKMVADIGLKIGQFGDRTRAEGALKHTEIQLRHSQKMEAVGRLAGGVAHDFNNLLTVIRGYTELILTRLTPDDPSRREMEEIKKAADRSAGLTGQLLAFSRRKFVSEKVLDLNALVSNMDGMLRRLLGEDTVEFCTSLDEELCPIKADPGQIEQIIMNLAVNARDAMPSGGRLTVETANVMVDNGSRENGVGLEKGEYVLLAVKDTGTGMDEETQSHIFEPFFTTKEKGKGTGLGLSTVYGIVKQAGGAISVESALRQGTAFNIYFPRAKEKATASQVVELPQRPTNGQETILLVEDEPAVRGLVHEMLRLHGYTVLVARHGIEALLISTKHLGPIHLILTDVVMPQMTGPEVAEKLKTLRPDTKVLYMSGYPDHPAFAKGGITRETAFLQKPFESGVLVRKVREVLDARKAA